MEETTQTRQGGSEVDWIEEKRAAMLASEQAGIADLPPLSDKIEDFWTTIRLPDGFESRTLVMRPKATPGDTLKNAASHANEDANKQQQQHRRPLIVLFHGGGFAIGSPAMMTRPGREFAERFGAVVVAPTYKLVPDEPWPSTPRSAWDVLVYLARHAERDLGAVLDHGFVVGGLSAGGSLATICAAVSLLPEGHDALAGLGGVEKLVKPITGVFANCPMLLTEEIVPEEFKDVFRSRDENQNSPGLDAAGVEYIWKIMNPDFRSPWTSPFNSLRAAGAEDRATSSTSSGLPVGEQSNSRGIPHYIQVAQYDPLRDDGVILEKALAARGVRTKIDLFPDDGHTSWCALALESIQKNPALEKTTMEGMAWLLRQQ